MLLFSRCVYRNSPAYYSVSNFFLFVFVSIIKISLSTTYVLLILVMCCNFSTYVYFETVCTNMQLRAQKSLEISSNSGVTFEHIQNSFAFAARPSRWPYLISNPSLRLSSQHP
jgi:hypothetical protein